MDIKRAYKSTLAKSGMTSTQVAEKLGINRSSLYRRLGRECSFNHVVEIWKAMGYELYQVGADKKAKKFGEE